MDAEEIGLQDRAAKDQKENTCHPISAKDDQHDWRVEKDNEDTICWFRRENTGQTYWQITDNNFEGVHT